MQTFEPPAGSSQAAHAGPSLLVYVFAACLLVPLLNGVPGGVMAMRGYESMVGEAAGYDEHFDPIVVSQGEVSAGPRIVYSATDRQTLLIDPDETVPDSEVTSPESVIIRRTTIVRTEAMRTQTYQVAAMVEVFGLGDFTVDSTHLAATLDSYRWHYYGLAALFYLANSAVDLAFIGIYGTLVAMLLSLVLRSQKVTVRSAVGPAIIAGVLTVPLAWALWAVGLNVGFLGWMVWPPVITVATAAWLLLTKR